MRKEQSRFKPWIWWTLAGIVIFSIPWYWPADVVRPFVIGLPLWAFVSLMMSLVFAIFVAWVILCHWDDGD